MVKYSIDKIIMVCLFLTGQTEKAFGTHQHIIGWSCDGTLKNEDVNIIMHKQNCKLRETNLPVATKLEYLKQF